jgi:hypothetical protein
LFGALFRDSVRVVAITNLEYFIGLPNLFFLACFEANIVAALLF